MKRSYRYTLAAALFAGVALAPAISGCSSSESAEESAQSSENATSSSNASEETASSEGGSSSDSSDVDSTERPELRELEGETKRLKARAEILEIKNEMQSHFVMTDAEELPDELADWTDGEESAFDDPELLKDPWGKQYIYRKSDEDNFELFSAGPDGEPGTEDDVRPNGQ